LFESGTGIAHNITIEDNIIHHILSGMVTRPSRGIMISGGATTAGSLYNITISNNIVHTTGKEGIRLQAPSGTTGLVRQNNIVASVNQEIGTWGTGHIVAPAEWTLSGNLLRQSFRSAVRTRL
jgi:hypothetical protein